MSQSFILGGQPPPCAESHPSSVLGQPSPQNPRPGLFRFHQRPRHSSLQHGSASPKMCRAGLPPPRWFHPQAQPLRGPLSHQAPGTDCPQHPGIACFHQLLATPPQSCRAPEPPPLRSRPVVQSFGAESSRALWGQSSEGRRQVEDGAQAGAWPCPSPPGPAPRIPAEPAAEGGPDHRLRAEAPLGKPRRGGATCHPAREVPKSPQCPFAAPGARRLKAHTPFFKLGHPDFGEPPGPPETLPQAVHVAKAVGAHSASQKGVQIYKNPYGSPKMYMDPRVSGGPIPPPTPTHITHKCRT